MSSRRGTRPGPSGSPAGPAGAALHGIIALALVLFTPVGARESGAPVVLETVERGEIVTEVSLNGSVIAPSTAQVSAATAGLIESVAVDVGDDVAEGATLAQLDARLDALSLQAARAGVQESRVQLAEAQRLLDEAEAAGARVNIPETEVRARANAVDEAQAVLARQRAETERQAAVVERHTVRAPFAGVISRRMVEQGEWVTPGAALYELVDTTRLRLEFAVPQDVYPRVQRDTALRVHVDADPRADGPRPGRIEAIVPVTDPGARTFRVRASVEDTTGLTPGMSVRGVLRLTGDEAGLLVPRDALNRYPEGRITVWTAVEEGGGLRARERRVRVGERFGDRVVVTSGLDSGDRVVVRGNAALEDGRRVAVQAR